MTVYELAERLRRRELSAREATQAYLERIAEKEGAVSAYLRVTAEQALEQAGDWENARARLGEYIAEYPEDAAAQKELQFLETR